MENKKPAEIGKRLVPSLLGYTEHELEFIGRVYSLREEPIIKDITANFSSEPNSISHWYIYLEDEAGQSDLVDLLQEKGLDRKTPEDQGFCPFIKHTGPIFCYGIDTRKYNIHLKDSNGNYLEQK